MLVQVRVNRVTGLRLQTLVSVARRREGRRRALAAGAGQHSQVLCRHRVTLASRLTAADAQPSALLRLHGHRLLDHDARVAGG